MPTLPDFRLESHFSKWEFSARYHLTASDAESMSLSDLLDLASPEDRAGFEGMWLGYTETYGAPDLRETIASTYSRMKRDDVLCFAGASEAIFAANNVILDKESHAIAITPNYQSHETLPLAICETSGVPLNPNEGWSLDLDRVAETIRPNTKLLTINFPHNPTGAVLSDDCFTGLIDLCRLHGIYVLHDEIFKGLGPTGARELPYISDVYERGLSLGVMSKSYGLPGLRIGWIACQDHAVLSAMERMKHYLSICNSGPSERLAIIALKNRKKLLARNCSIVDENLGHWEAFFRRYPELFEWAPPDASCMAYPRYLGPVGVENFARRLVEEAGVLVLPSSIYASDLCETPTDRFRIGLGRRGLSEGLSAMDAFLQRNRM